MSSLLLLLRKRSGPRINFSFMNGALPDGVSFARTSNATRFNTVGRLETVASGSPRFDFNPSTLALRGLLIEPQATNYIYPSSSFSGWSQLNMGRPASPNLSPDGSTYFTKLVGTAGGAADARFIYKGYTQTDSVAMSVFVKKNGYDHIVFNNGAWVKYAVFDLTNGTISSLHVSDGVTAFITPVNNDIFKIGLNFPAGKFEGSYGVLLAPCNGPTFPGSNHDGVSGVDVWGAQFVVGRNIDSSYIPTAASNATRAADQLSFTIPTGITALRYVFDDDTTQDVAVTSGAYTVPENLNRAWIKRIMSL